MQIIEVGKWVERVGSKNDYTTGRQGEITTLSSTHAKVYWTYHTGTKMLPQEWKHTSVKLSALKLISSPEIATT